MLALAGVFRAVLGLAAILLMGATASAATLTITGTVRDFCHVPIVGTCAAHPDFEFKPIAFDPGIVSSVLGVDGKPVYAREVGGTTTTTSKEAFDQWYRDVPGINAAMPLTLTLDNTLSGDPKIYSYINNSFFPIDDQLFGNQGLNHNFHFTFELHTQFTFEGTEEFTFVGDDDVWVFINNILAIDLGGIHGAASATVDLSSPTVQAALGMTPGNTYALDLFFAERHTVASSFRIETSLLLENPWPMPLPATLPLFGAGLVALAALRRRSTSQFA
jgi:fibro-slime domain-containing protein